MKTTITVNRHVIASNKRKGERRPVFSVKTYKATRYAHRILIDGPCEMIYDPDKPLSCGATCWMETVYPVTILERKQR